MKIGVPSMIVPMNMRESLAFGMGAIEGAHRKVVSREFSSHER
jgi:hypothetical protein